MNKKNDSPRSKDPAYQALDPEVRKIVDFFDKNYDNPEEVMRDMLAYIEEHKIQAD
jgi:hypothetical protein